MLKSDGKISSNMLLTFSFSLVSLSYSFKEQKSTEFLFYIVSIL